jgi:hypothetical protein
VEFSLESHIYIYIIIYICGPRFRLVAENGVMEVEVKAGSFICCNMSNQLMSCIKLQFTVLSQVYDGS